MEGRGAGVGFGGARTRSRCLWCAFLPNRHFRRIEEASNETSHHSARLQFTDAWAVGIGAFWEKYVISDSQTGEILNYMPGSFFLKLDDGGYSSWAGLASLTYTFGR
jgi:hypothetical protein